MPDIGPPDPRQIITREALRDGSLLMAARRQMPSDMPLLSDAELKFSRALELPTFTAGGMTLIKRMTLVIDDGVITKVFYPVFPPDKNAEEVMAWLRSA